MALLIAIILVWGSIAFAVSPVYKYRFPKQPASWGNPVSFNNLSPGFFQVMFQDSVGVIRIATYGISGGSMDTLKDPQLLMVFTFDQEKIGSKDNY